MLNSGKTERLSMWTNVAPYKALALQLTTRSVNTLGVPEARASMMESIGRIASQIRASCAFVGPDTRLVVLPEYFLTGFPMGESAALWKQKACLDPNGPEYAALGEIAVKHNLFLSGNAYENDVHFPELFFQTSFVIDPAGKVILRYRRLNSMYTATPHDVLDRYVEIYGWDALFPVARTAIGNLACLASEEVLYPEIARCLAMRGAEVFLHSTSEVGSLVPSPKNIAKQARALENLAYVVSANSAGIVGYDIPSDSTNGHSQVVHYEGHKLCEAGFGESMAAASTLHIEALRQHRSRPGMANYLSRMRNELFAPEYARSLYPANTLTNKVPERAHYLHTQATALERLRERGVIP